MNSPQTRYIFKGTHYTACQFKDSLIVQSNRLGNGKRVLVAEHWIENLKNALDDQERHEICKAILNH